MVSSNTTEAGCTRSIASKPQVVAGCAQSSRLTRSQTYATSAHETKFDSIRAYEINLSYGVTVTYPGTCMETSRFAYPAT